MRTLPIPSGGGIWPDDMRASMSSSSFAVSPPSNVATRTHMVRPPDRWLPTPTYSTEHLSARSPTCRGGPAIQRGCAGVDLSVTMGLSAAGSNGRSQDTEVLYREHGPAVARLCRSLLRDSSEAEDAAQQVFLSAHRALLNGSAPRDPLAWLLTVARHECYARS